jgi:long-chain acyl-CoA synthetase
MVETGRRTEIAAGDAARFGMSVAVTAREAPGRLAVAAPAGSRSFDELNARANQLVAALGAAGVGRGDAVALLCSNRAEFAEVWAASLRAGLRLTAINWHVGEDEAAYIVENCEARALVADARFAPVAAAARKKSPRVTLPLAVGGAIDGFEDYERALAGQPTDDPAEPVLGGTMLYTSGTTGRPKGVFRSAPPPVRGLAVEVPRSAGFLPGRDLCLCTGPLYHAAPLAFNLALPLNQGVGTVLMDGWHPEETLHLIERHRITHTHMVATMFHRLLALPDEVKARHDLSSLRYVLHGAAPTPAHVKKAMMDWLGPVLWEYYAATEGGGTFVAPEEWLRKPGSVGRPVPGQVIEIRDEQGQTLPPREVGTVWIKAPDTGRFEYYKDAEKTASAYAGEFFTLRDMGYFDEDGYLFLTGRTAEVIISGGVNIYPAEVDAVLLMHPAVADVAVVGVPNEEWGEEVKGVVQLRAGFQPDEPLARELIEHCRARLAHYKCPRSIDFAADLPRADTGKIYRRRVRERYWAGRERSI